MSVLWPPRGTSNDSPLLLVHCRGGGSKRTFASPKSQNSPNQQTVDCNDQQQACTSEQSYSSWSSAIGATTALIGPLLVLLLLIIMIKFCFYPKDQTCTRQHQAADQSPQYFSPLRVSLEENNHRDKQKADTS